jgi:hypothetical protein
MANPVVWFEIMGKDGKKLREFYGDIFDWKFEVMPDMDYGTSNTGSEKGIQGGVGTGMQGASYQTFYISVTDIKATLKKIEAKGGKTIVPYTEIPKIVTFAIFTDPEGHTIGLIEDRMDK